VTFSLAHLVALLRPASRLASAFAAPLHHGLEAQVASDESLEGTKFEVKKSVETHVAATCVVFRLHQVVLCHQLCSNFV
jgi:hypothetical protein